MHDDLKKCERHAGVCADKEGEEERRGSRAAPRQEKGQHSAHRGEVQTRPARERLQGPSRCTLCVCVLRHACSVLALSDASCWLMSQDCGTGYCKHQKRKSRCKVLFVVRCVCAACSMPVVCLHRLTPHAMLAEVTGLWRHGILRAPEKEEPVQGPFRCTLCGCGLLHACSVLARSDAWGG